MFVAQPLWPEVAVGRKNVITYGFPQGPDGPAKKKDEHRIRTTPGGVTMGMIFDEIVRLGLKNEHFVPVQFLMVEN